MQVINTQVSPRSAALRANADAMSKLVEDLRAKAMQVEQGSGAAARNKHVARSRLLPRDRVAQLLDPGTSVREIGQLAAHAMYDGDAPGASVMAGICRVQGDCMIVANDATVEGGTYYAMTVKRR